MNQQQIKYLKNRLDTIKPYNIKAKIPEPSQVKDARKRIAAAEKVIAKYCARVNKTSTKLRTEFIKERDALLDAAMLGDCPDIGDRLEKLLDKWKNKS